MSEGNTYKERWRSGLDKDGINAKLALLELAHKLGNVAEACRLTGYSRDSYYRIKSLHERGGQVALTNHSRRKPMPKNRVAPELEQAVVKAAFEYPERGQQRVAKQLCDRGFRISPGGVRRIWLRYDLNTAGRRLNALEAKVKQDGIPLTREQAEALQKSLDRTITQEELDGNCPGCLGIHKTLYIAEPKRIGPIYQHSFVDSYSSVAFARLDNQDTQSVDFMPTTVLPFYEKYGVRLLRVLTKESEDSNGETDYKAFLEQMGIDHLSADDFGPTSTEICDRFHKAVMTEFYAMAFRRKCYASLDELQFNLDEWLREYNQKRAQLGMYCYGKTPLKTFLDTIGKESNYP